MKTLKRIWNFDKDDMKVVVELFKSIVKAFIKGNYNAFSENCAWMKFFLTCDSEKINLKGEKK